MRGRLYRSALSLLALFLLGIAPEARSAEYTLVIQPILPAKTTKGAYQPLADYLSQQTGETITLVTAFNFFTYWETMKRGGEYDLILDAAHLTDFRIRRMDYRPLVKLPDVVSFSLVTAAETLVFSSDELVGKKIATLGSPSMGAVRLAELFPNPMRQPIIVEVNNSESAVDKLLQGEVSAAIIPSPIVGSYPELNTVTTTEQVPHMALSASPTVPRTVQERIRDALLKASTSPTGRKMLDEVKLAGFVKAEAATYDGFSQLLDGVWGYD